MISKLRGSIAKCRHKYIHVRLLLLYHILMISKLRGSIAKCRHNSPRTCTYVCILYNSLNGLEIWTKIVGFGCTKCIIIHICTCTYWYICIMVYIYLENKPISGFIHCMCETNIFMNNSWGERWVIFCCHV